MEQAITDLYKKFYNELFKWCCLMTQDEDMAKELVQEGFLRAIDHYDEIKALNIHQQRAWLYRTIKHIFIDTMRKRKNECLPGDVGDSADAGTGNFSFDDYSEKEIMCVIESMDKLEGKILVLRHIEGFSSKQIGEILKLPPGTVRSKLHDARAHLRALL